MKINKKIVLSIIAILWVIFSVGYIALDVWNDFKATKMAQSFGQGYAQAILSVAGEAKKCGGQGVPLNLGKDNEGKDIVYTIVGVPCLQQAQEQQNKEVAPAPAKK